MRGPLRTVRRAMRLGTWLLIGTFVLGGSAATAWSIHMHSEDRVAQELQGMAQRLTSGNRVSYFGDNIITWDIDYGDEILRVGVLNPNTITVDAKHWLGPRVEYYRITEPEPHRADEYLSNRMAVEKLLECTLSEVIEVPMYVGDTREAALREIAWMGFRSRDAIDYERWSGGPVSPAYFEPAPVTYLAYTPGDHRALGVASVSQSGNRYSAMAWACATNVTSVHASTSAGKTP